MFIPTELNKDVKGRFKPFGYFVVLSLNGFILRTATQSNFERK
jgi:hypothetical protein